MLLLRSGQQVANVDQDCKYSADSDGGGASEQETENNAEEAENLIAGGHGCKHEHHGQKGIEKRDRVSERAVDFMYEFHGR